MPDTVLRLSASTNLYRMILADLGSAWASGDHWAHDRAVLTATIWCPRTS